MRKRITLALMAAVLAAGAAYVLAAPGDVTYSQSGARLYYGAFQSGMALADSSTAITVTTNWAPKYIKTLVKDTDQGLRVFEWWDGMLTTNVLLTRVDADSGVFMYDAGGFTTSATGFTIPASMMNTDNDTIYWMACR